MSFTEAIKSGFDHYAKFDGRASRPAYWWWVLFVILVSIVVQIIDQGLFGSLALTWLVSLALFLPGLSVLIRRLHDTNRSGWWVLIYFIPLIGWIVLLVFVLLPSDEGENDYGPPMAPYAS